MLYQIILWSGVDENVLCRCNDPCCFRSSGGLVLMRMSCVDVMVRVVSDHPAVWC